jgi:predicted DNA binding protein
MTGDDSELLYLTVDIWHPNCWTLATTGETDAGLRGHGVIAHGTGVTGRYDVYGESHDAVETLITAAQESELVDETISVVPSTIRTAAVSDRVTQHILVDFDPEPSIRTALTARGFVHLGPSWHEDGHEQRSLLARADRQTVKQALAEIEAGYDADIELTQITTTTPPSGTHEPIATRLSPRQREALQLARAHGYYEYPRATTARALAAELDISKTTFLEHLRKAEAKLLTAIDLN